MVRTRKRSRSKVLSEPWPALNDTQVLPLSVVVTRALLLLKTMMFRFLQDPGTRHSRPKRVFVLLQKLARLLAKMFALCTWALKRRDSQEMLLVSCTISRVFLIGIECHQDAEPFPKSLRFCFRQFM